MNRSKGGEEGGSRHCFGSQDWIERGDVIIRVESGEVCDSSGTANVVLILTAGSSVGAAVTWTSLRW